MNHRTPGPLSFTNYQSLPKLMSIESVIPSSHLILFCPLLLPPIPPTIRVFSSESTLRMRWPKYWSFSLSISPSNEHPGLISFRMDWLDLLAVQGTPKSLLQHHSSKASILRRSAFFTVQLSHDYWKNHVNSVDMNLCKLREVVEDRGAWCATVHGVAKRWTQLSNWTTTTDNPRK